MKQIFHYGLVLFIIAGAAAMGLYGVNAVTAEKVKDAERKALAAGQKFAFPEGKFFGEPKTFEVDGKPETYYEVFDKNKKIIGYEVLYSVQGYQSIIKVLTGITSDGKIRAIKVLSQAETPGLGAEVDAIPSSETLVEVIGGWFGIKKTKNKKELVPAFQAQFDNKELEDLKVVKIKNDKNIEAISGSTITSKAVTRAVREPASAFVESVIMGCENNLPLKFPLSRDNPGMKKTNGISSDRSE